jgi:zinc transport system substrate-binding protein
MKRHEVNLIRFVILAIVLGMLLFGCASQAQPAAPANSSAATQLNPQAQGQLQIITSFRPFTLLVQQVAGKYAKITQILPPGADPHDYEPTPKDAITLQNGQVFFYDGPFLEPWAAPIAASANPNIVLASFADAVPPAAFAKMKSEYPNFPDTSQDPHLWLSPKLAEYFVPYVAQKLSSADPGNAAGYEANAQAFEARLQKLDSDYETGLANCTTRTFLTSHAFLNYVAAAYNLTAISMAGLSPDAEPSIQQMDAVLKDAKTANVQGVLSEPDETQALSESVASELGLPLYPFSTMEILPSGNQDANASDYIAIQENNLKEMRSALGCH